VGFVIVVATCSCSYHQVIDNYTSHQNTVIMRPTEVGHAVLPAVRLHQWARRSLTAACVLVVG